MRREEAEEALKVLEKCLCSFRWRLRPQARRRLYLDILALCTGLRPVVMIDYGGKMPELQENLYGVLCLAQKESRIFLSLRVMIIEEMVYLIHVQNLLDHMQLGMGSNSQLQFVFLDQGPMKLALPEHENILLAQFILIQKLLLSVMLNQYQVMMKIPSQDSLLNISDKGTSMYSSTVSTKNDRQKGLKFSITVPTLDNDSLVVSKALDIIDVSQCMMDTQISPPTLNGWLLGYPIVYIFRRENVDQAVRSLSIGSLHLFRILICSKVSFGKEDPEEEELMSFSVPANLSSLGKDEPWAETFLLHMLEKVDRCKDVWRSIKLEVTSCAPKSIAL
ncbi:uncharacterized protein LOC131071844 [Cryptomeria japonica]|uniref:uncharacterized protein LOC131071844 n=1 Tax=Cryptomeria japonica TaxID=3369 RepID=UPI0025ACD86C|nr:uncharacterized protein LOC131071844 [Cryptomeria japonica]XP_057863789.1 uncharacterized protein LOC131071844 [Cryptomeria japonica]XP_057863790.1 uncharacterized protein LOC131071844 [Cryptomeria japonica]